MAFACGSVQSIRGGFSEASEFEDRINKRAAEQGIPDFRGDMANVASVTMITLDELPHQVIKDLRVRFRFAAIVILISTLSIVYAPSLTISIVSIVLMVIV
jgi:hypothetical protein